MSKLDETTNLIELYMHHAGESQVPPTFHLWSCLAAMAATVADRFYINGLKEYKTIPNLYVLLLAPSGRGKNEAIDTVLKFVRFIPHVNLYRGKVTIQALADYMRKVTHSENGTRTGTNSKVFLVTPELSHYIRSGAMAQEFIKAMTEIYNPSEDPYRESTRTSGDIVIENVVPNWIAGSTKDWLMDSVTRADIVSGFFARICCIEAEVDYSKRYPRNIYPDDYAEVVDHLHKRFRELSVIGGEFAETTEAHDKFDAWFMKRAEPDDDTLAPTWERQGALVYKVAMLLSLAANTDYEDFVLEAKHINIAIKLTNRLYRSMPGVVSMSSLTPQAANFDYVQNQIKKHGNISHRVLMQRASASRHISGRDFAEIVGALMSMGKVTRGRPGTHGGMTYDWVSTED